MRAFEEAMSRSVPRLTEGTAVPEEDRNAQKDPSPLYDNEFAGFAGFADFGQNTQPAYDQPSFDQPAAFDDQRFAANFGGPQFSSFEEQGAEPQVYDDSRPAAQDSGPQISAYEEPRTQAQYGATQYNGFQSMAFDPVNTAQEYKQAVGYNFDPFDAFNQDQSANKRIYRQEDPGSAAGL